MSKNKTITIITGNYYPEDTAIGLYTYQFSKYLVDNGYEVNVLTAFPYYPQWKIWDNYKSKSKFYFETLDKIKVFRYKQYVPKKVTFLGRIFLMISLLYGTIINSFKIKNSDLIICIIPFTISVIPGIILKKRMKAKLWIHIQDFEFNLAFESGVLKEDKFVLNFFKKTIFRFESYLLNNANTISSISNNMMKKIEEKSKVDNLYYFPNWVSSNNINPDNYRLHKYISKEKFTLLYSGNIGEKQDWNFFEDLCAIIKDDEIEIVIVGEGGYLSVLKERISKYTFVKFFNLVPFNELSDLLCSANCHFLFQKTNVLDTIMPSKILGMMASGKPSIISGNKDSEVNNIFKNDCGFYFSNNDVNSIYQQIVTLKNNVTLAENIGENARKYILKHFSEDSILKNFENKIESELHDK